MRQPPTTDDPGAAGAGAPAGDGSLVAPGERADPLDDWRRRLEVLVAPPRIAPARLAAAAAGVVLVLVLGAVALRPTPPPPELVLPMAGSAADPASTTTTTTPDLLVHAAGAVAAPGVYRLPPGTRVLDLIDAAGGAAPDADLERLNLAAPLADGQRLFVPRRGEPVVPVEEGGGSGTGSDVESVVDLNTATAEQLEALPGIGPSTARAILDERGRRGRFTSVDDLLDVRGIGPAKLDALRDLVTV